MSGLGLHIFSLLIFEYIHEYGCTYVLNIFESFLNLQDIFDSEYIYIYMVMNINPHLNINDQNNASTCLNIIF